jgi:hypothetical protein
VCLWFVRWARLDLKWIFFRLEDQWFYFLYGEIFQFSEFRRFLPDTPPITGTYISAVLAHSQGDVLYKGFLWDFYLDKSGNLDRLLLLNAIRCRFDPEGDKDGARPAPTAHITQRDWVFERVSSQIFTFKYADCKTLSCTYFSIEEIQEGPEAH